MNEEKEIKLTEKFLRNYNLIKDSESLTDFINQPAKQSLKSIEELFQHFKETLGGVDLLKTPLFFALSCAFYEIEKHTNNIRIKVNSCKLKDATNKHIINDLSPYILMFFKWDLDRRVWKDSDDENKIIFLQKLTNEIDDELLGKKQIVKKYVKLIIEFVLSKFKDLISQFEDNEILYPFIENEIDSIRELESFVNTDKLDELIDNDVENSFSKIYHPVAQNYINGLLQIINKYDSLLYAFIEAQNDYKRIVKNLLISDITSDISKIRNALSNTDVDSAINILRALYSTIPNQLYGKQNEAIYHISFHIILKLIGCDIKSQVPTSYGLIDAVVEFPNMTYIIEIKLTTSNEALEQIKEKEYYLSYKNNNKTLYLLGIAYDTKKRNIKENYSLNILN